MEQRGTGLGQSPAWSGCVISGGEQVSAERRVCLYMCTRVGRGIGEVWAVHLGSSPMWAADWGKGREAPGLGQLTL